MIGLCCFGLFCMMLLRATVEGRNYDREGEFVLHWHFEGGRVGILGLGMYRSMCVVSQEDKSLLSMGEEH